MARDDQPAVPHRLPFIAQRPGRKECGLTCLAMLLAYHGRPASVDELAAEITEGPDGVTAADLVSAGRRRGLSGTGVRVDDPARLELLPFPCILHWDQNHFVVLDTPTPTGAWIVDPRIGRRFCTSGQLARHFLGTAILLEPLEG